jgi:hypothetical protein
MQDRADVKLDRIVRPPVRRQFKLLFLSTVSVASRPFLSV